MKRSVSKSKFKPRSLEYFREVESSGEPLIITDRGRPVLTIVPFGKAVEEKVVRLRNVVTKYDCPHEPVAKDEWESLK
jgi:prevent-host-death family protein